MTNSTRDGKATSEMTLKTLGGARIFSMAFTGANYDSDGTVTLKIAPALVRNTKNKATHIVIALDADDTYTVTAHRVSRKVDVSMVASQSMVYADDLASMVEAMTGLRLSLGTMRSVA